MIDSPKSLAEQMLNFTERVASEMRAVYNKIGNPVRKVNNVEPDSNGDVTIDLGVKSVNGSTGAVVLNSVASATQATQDSVGQQINTTYIKNVSVDGQTITFTRGDGTTFTITTQDTVTTNSSNWSVSNGTKGWARDDSTGFTIQWGRNSSTTTYFARTFTQVYSVAGYGNYGASRSDHSDNLGTVSKSYFETSNSFTCFWIAVGFS